MAEVGHPQACGSGLTRASVAAGLRGTVETYVCSVCVCGPVASVGLVCGHNASVGVVMCGHTERPGLWVGGWVGWETCVWTGLGLARTLLEGSEGLGL